MNDATLQLRDARFSYPGRSWQLHVADLHIGGGLTALAGPNGAGKSTLLRLAAGLLQPQTGFVQLNDASLAALPRRQIARQIGYLPQECQPLFDSRVQQTVELGRFAHQGWTGALTTQDRQAVDDALAAVDLQALRDRPLSTLSGGERRRALIAAVLAQQPRMILLDEPTAGLDLHHAAAVMRLLERLHHEQGLAVVVVTHDLNLAALHAQRLILMVDGAVRADGSPAEVMQPDVLQAAYQEPVLIHPHPETGTPMMITRKAP
jgi:iron complex transport system ATP-binding protein